MAGFECGKAQAGSNPRFFREAYFEKGKEMNEERKTECPHCKRVDYLEACDRCNGKFCGWCHRYFTLTDGTELYVCPSCCEEMFFDEQESIKGISEERKKALNAIFEHLKDKLREYYDLLDDDEQAASQHIGAAVAILAEYLDELDGIE